MTQPWTWKLCLPLMLITGCVFSAPAMASTDPKDVKVVYGADNNICNSIAVLYGDFNHKSRYFSDQDPDLFAPDVWDWEDSYPSDFAAIGLKPAILVKDTSIPNNPPWRAGYFSFSPSSSNERQLIYLRDVQFSSHGDFGTDLWLLKPGAPAAAVNSDNYDSPGGLNSDDVDVAVRFAEIWPISAESRPKYKTIQQITDSVFLGGGAVIQRPFLYENKTVILAHYADFSAAILYHFDEKTGIIPICIFKSGLNNKAKLNPALLGGSGK